MSYEDDMGRRWAVMVPEGKEDSPEMGIPVGPPDVDGYTAPSDFFVRLHNELFNRGLFDRGSLRGRGQELRAALQAALKVDLAKLSALYR